RSRVTLDLVVRAFNRGATPEEIAQDFPSLQLPDIYQVIGYYLKHGSDGRHVAFVSDCWPGAKIREVAGRREFP
ncbi:MAG TPA: DUF433 domain-containing protein, partial [Bryobacteraceae bacterium]|nr:DUF433 domain-containing protein [Bryobacteraceae bacterium]